MHALAYLQANAERLQIDPTRIVLAGDSAGAHISAQLATLITSPAYAADLGLIATTTPEQLRGVVLCCGPYDLGLARRVTSASGRRLIQVILWAYSGKRHFLDDPTFAAWSVTDAVTPAFPPALVTVGNSDSLRAHSELLVERLRAQGVETQTVFFPDDQAPPLGHEYQFDLDTEAAQLFFARLLAFLQQSASTDPQQP
jgi:acetyl esterase/lipase